MSMFMDDVNSRSHATYKEPTGAVENYQAALGTMIESGLSISALLGDTYSQYRTQRNQQIDELIASGDIPEEYKQALGSQLSYKDMAYIAKDTLGIPVRTDEDIDELIRDDIRRNDARAKDIFSNASTIGKASQIVGTLHGAMLDPISTVGTLIGFGAAAKGATILSRISRAGVVAGAAAAAEEAAIQPFVYNWKKDVGLDHSVAESIKSIGYAFGGGAAFGAAAKTVASAGEIVTQGRKFLSSHPVARAKNTDVATREAYKLVEDRIDEAAALPPDTDITKHSEGVDGYIKKYDTQQPVSESTMEDLANATDDELVKAFNSEVDVEVPYVRGISDKQEITLGDAKVDIADIDNRVKVLDALNNCLGGGV